MVMLEMSFLMLHSSIKMENEGEAIVNSLACQPYCISWMDALLSYLLLLIFVYYSIDINQT